MIVVFDTCIILDFLMDRTPFAEDAEELMIEVADGEIEGLITMKSIMDVHYVLKHTLHDEKKTRETINILFESFILVDSSAEDALNALSSETKDFEDALMIETAKSCHADCIVTRNIKDYKKSDLNVYDPKKLMRMIS